MKIKKYLLYGLLFCALPVRSQTDSLPPAFQLLRAEENWKGFAASADQPFFLDRIKYLDLGRRDGAYLTLGGNIRSEFQYRNNEGWIKSQDDGALFQRVMWHADWRITSRLRFFTQFKTGLTAGRAGPELPLDKDLLGVHQAFLGWRSTDGKTVLRFGRQELVYGSGRLISIREGTNIRQSFEGLKFIRKSERGRLDLLFFLYNPVRTGLLDNRPSTDQMLWGGYYVWSLPGSADQNLDIYYLGVRNEQMQFDDGAGRENRHSLGLRHWGKWGRLSYNSEAVIQFGSLEEQSIRAWTQTRSPQKEVCGG